MTEKLYDTGYKPWYQDGDDQAHHFWFYVQIGALHGGKPLAWTINIAHETVIYSSDDPNNQLIPGLPVGKPWDFTGAEVTLAPPFISLGHGRSATDILLGWKGARLGKEFREGVVVYSETGDWIRNHLGSGDPSLRLHLSDLGVSTTQIQEISCEEK